MSKLSDWWHHATSILSDKFHTLLTIVKPALEDLGNHAADVLKDISVQVTKDTIIAVKEAHDEGKDLKSKDVINELIHGALKSAEQHAEKAALPLLQTTLHTVASQVVQSALDIHHAESTKAVGDRLSGNG